MTHPNPYPAGSQREAWQRGYEGLGCFANTNSDYTRIYKLGEAAGRADHAAGRADAPQAVAVIGPDAEG